MEEVVELYGTKVFISGITISALLGSFDKAGASGEQESIVSAQRQHVNHISTHFSTRKNHKLEAGEVYTWQNHVSMTMSKPPLFGVGTCFLRNREEVGKVKGAS